MGVGEAHHPLGDVDAVAEDVRPPVDIRHDLDRPEVDADAQREIRIVVLGDRDLQTVGHEQRVLRVAREADRGTVPGVENDAIGLRDVLERLGEQVVEPALHRELAGNRLFRIARQCRRRRCCRSPSGSCWGRSTSQPAVQSSIICMAFCRLRRIRLKEARENRDFVLARFGELFDGEVPGAHLVSGQRHLPDRLNDHPAQHQVEDDEGEDEHRQQRRHEGRKGALRILDRQRHGHGDDLRADDLVQFPAEAVGVAVELEHGCRRRRRDAVAGEAGGIADANRARDVERAPGRCFALADESPWFPRSLRNTLTRSASQSVARLRRFVGLSVASL